MKTSASPGAKTARITVFLSIVLLILLFLGSFVWFPRTEILPVFKGKWIILKSLSNFLLFFPAFFCSVILLSLTVFPRFLSESNRSFRSYAVLIILVMMIHTGLNEIVNPKIQNNIDDIEYLTRSGQELLESAFEAEQEGDYERAYENLIRYREIDPQNIEINRAFDRITMLYAAERTNRGNDTTSEEEESTPSYNNTAESLTQRARDFLDEARYDSAYYYATIAEELGSEEAAFVRQEAWEKIQRVTPGREEEESRILFTRKAEGQSSLSYGNSIEAYYLFQSLHAEYPEDREIEQFLEDAEEQVEKRAFFLEEVIQALSYPGYTGIFFILENNEEETILFYAQIGIITQEGMFFRQIEMMTIDAEAEGVKQHLIAPYGKFVGNTMMMQCIHRIDPETRFTPRYLVGGGESSPPVQMHFDISKSDFQHFSRREHNTEVLSFGDLLYLLDLWPARGYRTEPLLIELLMRIMYPFSFLVFAFFSLSIGIRSRRMYDQSSVSGYFLIPLVPFLFYFIIHFFYYLNRVFLSFLFGLFGFTLALIFLALVQGGLLLFSISRGLKRLNLSPS